MGNREERFGVLMELLAANSLTATPKVLDLCCGPGSLSARLLKTFPEATVVAVDTDPVLQLLGQKVYGTLDGRLQWVNHDVSDPAWENVVGAHGPFDAVFSTTALHYLRADTLSRVYEAVWRLLVPGGIFADGDHLAEGRGHGRLRALGAALRVRSADEREEYRPWWVALEAAAATDPELAAAFDARALDGSGHPETEDNPDLPFHEAALVHAGFAEVGTIWQRGDDRVLVGVRA